MRQSPPSHSVFPYKPRRPRDFFESPSAIARVASFSYIPTNPSTAMKVSHYPHDDPTGHGAQYNMSPPMGNPNYRPDGPQYQGHQDQPHMHHSPNDQQQYGYGPNPQGHRASQSSQGQGGQGEMLGRAPTRGPNPLIPLDSPSNHNGADGTPILPAVQQQVQDQPPSFSIIELGRRYT